MIYIYSDSCKRQVTCCPDWVKESVDVLTEVDNCLSDCFIIKW